MTDFICRMDKGFREFQQQNGQTPNRLTVTQETMDAYKAELERAVGSTFDVGSVDRLFFKGIQMERGDIPGDFLFEYRP